MRNRDSVVLDSFAGSGTTAQAVLELNKKDGGNRKFILVECEDYADAITAERVRRVIQGAPDARDAVLREGMGGSFTYCTLGEPIEIEGMLIGEALPTFPSLAAYLLHTASGVSAGQDDLEPQDDDGLFYATDTNSYYLLYEPDIDYLCSNEAMLNEERAKTNQRRHPRAWQEGYSLRRRQVHRPTGAHALGHHVLPTALRVASDGVKGGPIGGVERVPVSRFGSLQPLAGSP